MTLAKKNPAMLSFSNLIEAHVLRSLRTEHGVHLVELREALTYAQRELNIDQLLVREELRAAGGRLFRDRYVELVKLPPSGRFAIRKAFEAHLRRVEWGSRGFAVRLYPFVAKGADAKPIVIDPRISFGRPVVSKAFVSTVIIRDRIDAGERVENVARDYDLTAQAVGAAMVFERAS